MRRGDFTPNKQVAILKSASTCFKSIQNMLRVFFFKLRHTKEQFVLCCQYTCRHSSRVLFSTSIMADDKYNNETEEITILIHDQMTDLAKSSLLPL